MGKYLIKAVTGIRFRLFINPVFFDPRLVVRVAFGDDLHHCVVFSHVDYEIRGQVIFTRLPRTAIGNYFSAIYGIRVEFVVDARLIPREDR